MFVGWRQKLFPTRTVTAIGQQMVFNPPIPTTLLMQRRSTLGRSVVWQRLNYRTIHNLAFVTETSRVDKGDSSKGNKNRTFRSQSRNNDRKCNRVLIVGGGPTGLFLAHLLRSYEVPFRLIEAQTPKQRFKHPQAHFLNTRTMEILKHSLSYLKIFDSNHPNKVYDQVRNAMPPVEEWKSFRFGPDMTCTKEKGTILAKVDHPVDRPLAAKLDANGRLVVDKVDGMEEVKKTVKNTVTRDHVPLSPESVGHLAQHKFCRILYDALVSNDATSASELSSNGDNFDLDREILYGRSVTEFDWNEESRRWTVKTDRQEVFDDVDIIFAADGAASSVRRNLFPSDLGSNGGNDSTMLGTQKLQTLINVHFEIPAESSRCEDDLHNGEHIIPPAMLYTVFHPEVLAMVVRHGPGDYVLQIPYFEPYQTPEEDFSIHKVRKMVRSILGNTVDFTIHSVRPWTMGSLVARNYYTDEGVFLVGDAAHVFPPAGGFGMNTGLQDAFSLAWRIALNRHQQRNSDVQQSNKNGGNIHWSLPSTIGTMYERERQPVARSNAALSVRNYRRVLNVMRACYLDDRHPALLIKALDATALFIPIEIRRKTFRTLLQTALKPLSQLNSSPDGIYARTIKDNLRALLGSGQGLPLLFPGHELDFSYDELSETKKDEKRRDDWAQDSIASSARLAAGMLFPHVTVSVPVETIRRFPRLQPIDDNDIQEYQDDSNENGRDRLRTSSGFLSRSKVSTRDLAAQLSTDQFPLSFCLLEITTSMDDNTKDTRWNQVDDTLPFIGVSLERKFGIRFVTSKLVVSRTSNVDVSQLDQKFHNENTDTTICTMYIDCDEWDALNFFPTSTKTKSCFRSFVAIRPDGHVAAISDDGAHYHNLISGIENALTGM